MTYAIVMVLVIGGIGLYYFFYFKKIREAGGMAAAGLEHWRQQFGLDQGEFCVSMGIGTFYIGPLVPETMRSTGEQVMDALTSTTWRGANLFLAFTTRDRLAIAVEETEDGPQSVKTFLMNTGYGQLGLLGPHPRPRCETAEEAWPGSKDLPKDAQKPQRINMQSRLVRQQLVRLTTPDGRALVIYVEPDWVEPIRSWCAGGPTMKDPAWTSVLPARENAGGGQVMQ